VACGRYPESSLYHDTDELAAVHTYLFGAYEDPDERPYLGEWSDTYSQAEVVAALRAAARNA